MRYDDITQEEAHALREFLSPSERALFDRALWNPAEAVERYRAKPVDFFKEVLHMELTPYQEKTVNLLAEQHRVCFRGPHGAGKTAMAAGVILWFVGCHEECKVPTTASTWRHLKDFLWPEIHKWAQKAEWWRVGVKIRAGKELMKTRLAIGTSENRFAFAISSNDEAKIEGAHSGAILYVFDEAKTIDPAIWDAAEGALGTPNSYAMAMSTPGNSTGRFYEIQTDRDKWRAWQVVYATAAQVIAAGHMTKEWLEAKKREWGENSVMYKRRALGQFAEDDRDVLVPLHLVEQANELWKELMGKVEDLLEEYKDLTREEAENRIWGPLKVLGVDPAWMGTNNTGYAYACEPGIKEVQARSRRDTMATAGETSAVLRNNPECEARIDVNGWGAGVHDRVKEVWRNGELRRSLRGPSPVVAVQVQHGAKDAHGRPLTDKSKLLMFSRKRDYLWWMMREKLEAGNWALPPDEELTRDLTTPTYGTTSSGLIKVEDKDSMKKRLGRSPDVGDAVVMASAPQERQNKPLIAVV